MYPGGQIQRYPPSSVPIQVEFPKQGFDVHRWLSGDTIHHSSYHSVRTFLNSCFTVIILLSQGHTMHNLQRKSSRVMINNWVSPWSHWLPTQPWSHTHCQAFSHVPWTQPGKIMHCSHVTPFQPGLHLKNNIWVIIPSIILYQACEVFFFFVCFIFRAIMQQEFWKLNIYLIEYLFFFYY